MGARINEDSSVDDPNREIKELARQLAITSLIWSGLEEGTIDCLELALDGCSYEFLEMVKKLVDEAEFPNDDTEM